MLNAEPIRSVLNGETTTSKPRTVSIHAEGIMPYENLLIDPKHKDYAWVRASQVRPANPSDVHDLIVFVLPPGTDDSDKTNRGHQHRLENLFVASLHAPARQIVSVLGNLRQRPARVLLDVPRRN
jgi:hypothetical protein